MEIEPRVIQSDIEGHIFLWTRVYMRSLPGLQLARLASREIQVTF